MALAFPEPDLADKIRETENKNIWRRGYATYNSWRIHNINIVLVYEKSDLFMRPLRPRTFLPATAFQVIMIPSDKHSFDVQKLR